MTPEERRREELRRKAGLDSGPVMQAAPQAPNLNIANAPDAQGQRRAELRAKADLDAAPVGDPNLDTLRVPDRMFGLPMPYSQGETDIASNAGQGYQVALPSNAPEGVRRAILTGAGEGRERRKRFANLTTRGATTLASNPGGLPVSGFVDSLAGGLGGGRSKTLERIGAASYGAQDIPTLGFSDEIVGALHGPDAGATQRQGIKDAYREHPLSTAAGGIPMMAAPFGTIRGTSTLARTGSAFARGGTPAAAYGYGSGEGDALSADRLTRGVVGGVSGGALGGGFVLGQRGLDYAGRKILGSAELRSVASHLFGNGSSQETIKLVENAITEVQRAARVEGRSIARDVAKRELTDALRRAEANDMLGDLIPGGVTGMEGSALPGMQGADMVIDALRTRGEGQYDRINAAVGKLVDGEDIESSLANLAQIKQEEAKPLYNAAFAPNKVVDPNHPRFPELRELIKLDDFKRGRSAGERVWRLETGNSEAQFNQLNPFEQIDWIKKGLDAEIGKLLRAGDNTTAGAMIGAKNKMLAIADDMNPEYAQARQVWSGAQGQQDALLLGESLFNASGQVKTGQALREIRKQYDSFSEAQKTAFSIGLFEKAMDSVGTVIESGTANSAKRGFLTPNSERALREFLPQEQAGEFLELMQREYRQQMNANQALSGSPTGRRINAGEAVRMATGGARAAAAELSDPQGLLRKAQQKIRDTIGNNPKVQRGFAEFLTRDANDPDLLRALGVPQQRSTPLPGSVAPSGQVPQGPTIPTAAAPSPAAAVAASQGKPVANGLDVPYIALQERGTLAGMAGGAGYGAQNPEDMDGDGDIDNKDVLLTSLVYSGYGGLAGRTAKGVSRKLTGTKPITNAQYLKSQAIVTTKNPGLASNTPEFKALVKQDLKQRGYVGDMPGAAAARNNSGLSQEQQIGILVSNWTESGQPLSWSMPKLVKSVGFKRAMETAEKAILKRHPDAPRELVARKIIENSDLKGMPEAQDYLKGLSEPKLNSQAGAPSPAEAVAASRGILGNQRGSVVINNGKNRRQTQNDIRDGLKEAGGRSRAPVSIETGEPIAGLPESLQRTAAATTPIPGVQPSYRGDVTPAQARGQLREDLISAGDNEAQVDQLLEILGDDVVQVLRDRQLGPAVSRGIDGNAGDGGEGLGILLGLLGAGGAATAIQMAMRDSGNTKATMQDVMRALDRASRQSRGLPPTPQIKPPLNLQ